MIPAHTNGAVAAGSKLIGHSERERFIDDYAFRVSAVGYASQDLVLAIVGEHRELFAVLFKSFAAASTNSAGPYHAANGAEVTLFEFLDGATRLHDAPHDFMAGYAGINSRCCAFPIRFPPDANRSDIFHNKESRSVCPEAADCAGGSNWRPSPMLRSSPSKPLRDMCPVAANGRPLSRFRWTLSRSCWMSFYFHCNRLKATRLIVVAHAFMLQKPALTLDAAAIAGERTVGSDDAVARHHNSNWIGTISPDQRP